MKNKIISFCKKETILVISLLLALISMFFVHPDIAYIDYIDWHTLIMLFCLMAVMAGFKKLGLFSRAGALLLSHVKNTRQLFFVLVFMPFFFSMFITNDVSLITFVPFAITVLRMSRQESMLIPVVCMQTIAANLGSMLTPMGNPQNLYLYAKSGMTLLEFLWLMLPFTCVAAVCLFLYGMSRKKCPVQKLNVIQYDHKINDKIKSSKNIKQGAIFYGIAFLLCLFCVSKLLNVYILLAIITCFVLIYDRNILLEIDYSLLLTFIGFFIFIGNMQRIGDFQVFLQNIVTNHEIPAAILSSQIISNVPAALLLSGFSDNRSALIIGTNLGGLGTLIASMASLISYKQIAREYPGERGRYLLFFTVANIVMLFILLFVCLI